MTDKTNVTQNKKHFARWIVGVLVLALLLINSCSTLADAVATVGLLTGYVDEDQAAAISQAGQAVEGAFADITPEQEYYIGRSVTALILDTYTLYDDPEATRYINLLGQSLAAVSSRPILFNGYRFAILDTDEINAFATPGGHILISRGMLRLTADEHMLAAVLSHEISHVVLQHGLKAIKTSRWSGAGKSLGVLALEMAADDSAAGELTQMFGESLLDITDTLLVSGYSRNQEKDADAEAVSMMISLGYDPSALVDLLSALEENTEEDGPGFGSTHPKPALRIDAAQEAMGEADFPRNINNAQRERFAVLADI
jgi:predicted Zn-dependent protease